MKGSKHMPSLSIPEALRVFLGGAGLRAPGMTDATSALFSGSASGAFCHDQGGNALLDGRGNSVSITGDWRATMMAHTCQDPAWRPCAATLRAIPTMPTAMAATA